MNLVHEGVLDPNEPDFRDEKREAEEARRERESVTKCNWFCNAAETRDALVTILDKVNCLDEECGVDPVEIRDIARAALSAPAAERKGACDA